MKQTRCTNILLAVLDTALCLFVFFPLSVMHWRGTWDLLDVYIIPNDLFYSSWVTLGIGSVVCILCALVQPFLFCNSSSIGKVCIAIVTRLYMYVFAWAVLCYWRGLWNLMDIYMGDAIMNSVIFYVLGVSLAALFRTLRTIPGIPMQVQIDTDPELVHEPDTRFKIKPTDMCMFLVDICFSQFVLVSLGIFVWRGIWNVLDHTLYPNDAFMSDVSSLCIGYAVLISLFILEYPASMFSARLDKHAIAFKVVFEDLIMVVSAWGVLMLWRGAWNLMHTYFLPDKVVGGWVSHSIAVVGLLILQGFGNVATNGIDIDGSYSGGSGIFQTNYLRYILHRDKNTSSEKDIGKLSDASKLKQRVINGGTNAEENVPLLSDEESDVEWTNDIHTKEQDYLHAEKMETCQLV